MKIQIKPKFKYLLLIRILLLFVFLHVFLFPTYSSSQTDDPLTKVALRLETSKGGISTASFVRHEYGQKDYYFLITTYHSVYRYKKDEIRILDGEMRGGKIGDFIDPSKSLFIEPALDLVVFQCSVEGWQRLKDEFNRKPLNIVKKNPSYVDVRAVGNPTLILAGEESTCFNCLSWACISGYPTIKEKLPESIANEKARETKIMMLESLHVTYGYSGGPVVVSQSVFRKPDYEFAGIIQGGIPGEPRSWAIPANEIKKAIEFALRKKRFHSYPLKDQQWPTPLFNYEDDYYEYSIHNDFYCEIIERHPTIVANGTSFLELFANKKNKIFLKVRFKGTGKQLTVKIAPEDEDKNWFKISKSSEIRPLPTSEGLFEFDLEIIPVHGTIGEKKLKVNFESSSQDQTFSIPFNVRVKPLPRNLSFNFTSTTDFNTRWSPSVTFFQRIHNKFAIGLEVGYQNLKISRNYDVLPGFPRNKIEIMEKSIYLNGLLRIDPFKIKNLEPYSGIGIGIPFNTQILLGADLIVSKLFELGIEARFIYYSYEISEITFNIYGDATEEIKTKYGQLLSLGLKLGLNF